MTENILQTSISRRELLKVGAAASSLLIMPTPLRAAPHILGASKLEKTLSFYNTHTGEHLKKIFWANGKFVHEHLKEINHLMRDHRNQAIKEINPKLLLTLHDMLASLGTPHKTFDVISGYRSPHTNKLLRMRSKGVAQKSLHTKGDAIDVRLSGVRLTQLRDVAKAQKVGGVGFYPGPNFIHVDVRPKIVYW